MAKTMREYLRGNVALYEQEQEEKAQAKLEAEERARAEQKQRDQYLAQEMLKKVEANVLAASNKGKWSCEVYKIKGFDVKHFGYHNNSTWYPWHEPILSGAPKLVYEGILAMGLIPYVSYEHDGIGIESWHMLRVTWETEEEIKEKYDISG